MTLTTPSPTSGELGNAQPVTTLLGKGSEFEGKLSFEGTVRVDGKLTGEIFTDDVLIVGEGAEVNAEVTVGAIVIQGIVRGNITAKRSVEIHSPGQGQGQHQHALAVHRKGRILRRPLPDGFQRRHKAIPHPRHGIPVARSPRAARRTRAAVQVVPAPPSPSRIRRERIQQLYFKLPP
jgi:cytoskeletal protein CcmA (bactofilin family)